jgi:hypothetical protein
MNKYRRIIDAKHGVVAYKQHRSSGLQANHKQTGVSFIACMKIEHKQYSHTGKMKQYLT